jgi:hypothetical protein
MTGTVASLSHRHEGLNETRVSLDTPNGMRSLVVPGDDADHAAIVGALVEAYSSGSEISVLAMPDAALGRIERFRLGRRP